MGRLSKINFNASGGRSKGKEREDLSPPFPLPTLFYSLRFNTVRIYPFCLTSGFYFLSSSNLFFICSNWSPSIFACDSSIEISCSFGIAGMPIGAGATGAPAGACCCIHEPNCGICPVWTRYCAAGGNPVGVLPIQPGEYPNLIQPGKPVR